MIVTMVHRVLFVIIALASGACSSLASTPAPAYMLCADTTLFEGSTVYYLQPLMSSTEHPLDPSQPLNISFDSSTSVIIYNATNQKSQEAQFTNFVDNSRANLPLLGMRLPPEPKFILLDMVHWSDTLLGSIAENPLTDGFTYVEYLDSYWKAVVANVESQSVTLSIYDQPFASKQEPVFSTEWIGGDGYSSPYMASDSHNKVIYMSMIVTVGHPSNEKYFGQLFTYSIDQNSLGTNCSFDDPMLIRYSPSRKALFAAALVLNSESEFAPSSIVEIDPTSCKTRVLIDNLPTNNQGVLLRDAFNDATGEWYFQWQTQWNINTSLVYSINTDSKKVTEPINLVYADATQLLLDITTFQSPSDLLTLRLSHE